MKETKLSRKEAKFTTSSKLSPQAEERIAEKLKMLMGLNPSGDLGKELKKTSIDQLKNSPQAFFERELETKKNH